MLDFWSISVLHAKERAKKTHSTLTQFAQNGHIHLNLNIDSMPLIISNDIRSALREWQSVDKITFSITWTTAELLFRTHSLNRTQILVKIHDTWRVHRLNNLVHSGKNIMKRSIVEPEFNIRFHFLWNRSSYISPCSNWIYIRHGFANGSRLGYRKDIVYLTSSYWFSWKRDMIVHRWDQCFAQLD